MEPEPPGAGADPIWSKPESAPGPRTSGVGAAQRSGGSGTLPVLKIKVVATTSIFIFAKKRTQGKK